MDLNKLKTFCCVAEMGSVTKAAWYLSRTQSAITQQIQLLEEELGLALLERRNARVYLTKEGQRLYAHARERLLEIEDEASRIKKDSTELSGTIRISAVDEVYGFILPDLIEGFCKAYPKILIEVNSGPHELVEADVIENRADFGLMVIYQDRKMFDIHPCFPFEAICLASPAYLKEKGTVKNFRDLLTHRIIDSHQHVPGFRFWIKKNAPGLVSDFANQQAFISIRGAKIQKDLILRGLGVGLVARTEVEEELKDGRLVEVLPGRAKPLNVFVDIARRKVHTSHLIHE
ncbi:MAG: LysR family transcriptional regulator, partial [Sphingomonadales bacterium]